MGNKFKAHILSASYVTERLNLDWDALIKGKVYVLCLIWIIKFGEKFTIGDDGLPLLGTTNCKVLA